MKTDNFSTITWQIDGAIARLTLNRPDKLNSFTGEMFEEINLALDHMETEGKARVLIISGHGRAFCAGQDLADPTLVIDGENSNLGALIENNYKPIVMRLHNLKMPTIAAVNGIAAGAGANFAFACDLVIACQSASFLQAFSKIGLMPDTGGTWFLPQRIGMARAMGLAFLAEKISAEKAAEWGLIWQVVTDDVFPETVTQLAQQLSIMPTNALVQTRQTMHVAHQHTLEEQLDLEKVVMDKLGKSHDFAEGVAAFTEKRKPVFTGK